MSRQERREAAELSRLEGLLGVDDVSGEEGAGDRDREERPKMEELMLLDFL